MEQKKVMFLGDSGVGKSSILSRWLDDEFYDNVDATVGASIRIKTVVEHHTKMETWDVSGQGRFRIVLKMYCRAADLVAVVFDLTKKQSFEHVDSFINEVKEQREWPDYSKFILVGNKADLNKEREVTLDDAETKSGYYDIPYFETSAKDGQNINGFFDKLVAIATAKHPDPYLDTIEAIKVVIEGQNYSKDIRKAPMPIERVNQLCKRALDDNDKMTPQKACQKIDRIVARDQLLKKDNVWAKIITIIRNILAKIGIGMPQDERKKTFEPIFNVMNDADVTAFSAVKLS